MLSHRARIKLYNLRALGFAFQDLIEPDCISTEHARRGAIRWLHPYQRAQDGLRLPAALATAVLRISAVCLPHEAVRVAAPDGALGCLRDRNHPLDGDDYHQYRLRVMSSGYRSAISARPRLSASSSIRPGPCSPAIST